MVFLYLLKKLLGNLGLKILFILMAITSFILTFKYITLGNLNVNANCITYITMFSAIYLLLENDEEKETKKLININFISCVFCLILLYIMIYHI